MLVSVQPNSPLITYFTLRNVDFVNQVEIYNVRMEFSLNEIKLSFIKIFSEFMEFNKSLKHK